MTQLNSPPSQNRLSKIDKNTKQQEKFTLNMNYTEIFLSLEIAASVFSLIVLIFQFALAISLAGTIGEITSSKSYNYIVNNIINAEMIHNMSFTEGNCVKPEYPYNLRIIDEIEQVCIKTKNDKTVLRFEKDCTDNYLYPEEKKINKVMRTNICYQTFPRSFYVYYFNGISDRCNDGDMLCGQSETMIICLKKTDKINKCPVINLSLASKSDPIDNNSFEAEYIKEAGFSIILTNFTTINNPFLSFKLFFESDNEKIFYDFLEKDFAITGDLYKSFDRYYEKLDDKSNSININENYKGRISDASIDMYSATVKNFFATTNISISQNLKFMHESMSPDFKFFFRKSNFPLPSDKCIEEFFIQNKDNNSRGFFSLMSDLSMDFLQPLTTSFITWNFIQLGSFFVYSFFYRVIALSGKINKTFGEMNKSYEKLTVLTLKCFYYLSLAIKYLILFNGDSIWRYKFSLIDNITIKKCFEKYDAKNQRISLLHLNLNKFRKEDFFTGMTTKVSIIFNLIYIECVNEGLSLIFILLDLYDKIIKKT